jgi:hypothetical protein
MTDFGFEGGLDIPPRSQKQGRERDLGNVESTE